MSDLNRIRNFSIIAHIDHGKSTLADRLLERCGAIDPTRDKSAQILDSMSLEKERGITIKAQTACLTYHAKDGQTYQLNLIDTPGHVDFAYEVGRSLAACEGSLLVVDATQGVEAQTLANVYQALDHNHTILPVLNKMDLASANPEKVQQEIEEMIGLDATDALFISAKSGLGIDELLEAIVTFLPAPEGDAEAPLKALLVDSWYDPYSGVVLLVRVFEGVLKVKDSIVLMGTGAVHTVEHVGVFAPAKQPRDCLRPGEVGYIVANIRQLASGRIGDTLTSTVKPTAAPFPGFKPAVPVVFCSLFSAEADHFEHLRDGLTKLNLNDSSFTYEPDSSTALGFGFRCGFLGLLHLEIIQERLSREFNLDLIATAPSVAYNVFLTNGTHNTVHNPADMPPRVSIERVEEPLILATILTPHEHLGGILQLCTERRGVQVAMEPLGTRTKVVYKLPLNEVVFDFFDHLKSVSRGYASFDYEMHGYAPSDLVKISILVNGEPADALSFIVHRSRAEARGRTLCLKLKELIPRQLFKVALQAAIEGKVVAREDISAMSKDVTAKCYGGDASRKRKLLDKQKEGKKRMRQIGRVDIPQSAFIEVLKTGRGEN